MRASKRIAVLLVQALNEYVEVAVRNYARHRVGEPSEADDVAQEAFAEVLGIPVHGGRDYRYAERELRRQVRETCLERAGYGDMPAPPDDRDEEGGD